MSEPKKISSRPADPMVRLIYIDSVMDNNTIPLGKGRLLTGSGRRFSVTLSEFESDFMTPLVMSLLRSRKFIVLEGLTPELRRQYDCDYAPGEVLLDPSTARSMLDMTPAEAETLFSALCLQHRELVGNVFAEAYSKGDPRVTREVLERLNAVSSKDYPDGRGVFREILKDLNSKV